MIVHFFYIFITYLAYPFYRLFVFPYRIKCGKEDSKRFREKLGYATVSRPLGKLIWFHAASVGESLSILELVKKILEEEGRTTHILVTSGTLTSAVMIKARFPKEVIHQYAPVDFVPCVSRFLANWRPDACLWVESELWPTLVHQAHKCGVPMILMNMRLSDRSLRRWRKMGNVFKGLLSHFDLILTQTQRLAGDLIELGLANVKFLGNLKYASAIPNFDQSILESLSQALKGKKIWLVASTHPGEEEQVLALHSQFLAQNKNTFLILVPRHPNRCSEVEEALKRTMLSYQKFSKLKNSFFEAQEGRSDISIISFELRSSFERSCVLLVDEIGLLPLFYALSPVTVVGGTLVPHIGGHNMIEPLRQGSIPFFGPYYYNFVEVAADMLASDVAVCTQTPQELYEKLEEIFENPALLDAYRHGQKEYLEKHQLVLKNIYQVLAKKLAFSGATQKNPEDSLVPKGGL